MFASGVSCAPSPAGIASARSSVARALVAAPTSAPRGRVQQRAVAVAASPDAPWKKKDTRLVLADGSVFHGAGFGSSGTEVGEVVFNTALTGYQEVMTDPSYKGQFVAFTVPHIGNTGINDEDTESSQCHLRAIIVRDLSIARSNYRATKSLTEYCQEQGVIGISEVDTRQLTRKLREFGCINGVISTDPASSDEDLMELARGFNIEGQDLLNVVTCTEPYDWATETNVEWEFNDNVNPNKLYNVVCYDFGIKHNILRRLATLGCKLTVVPATTPASEVLAMNPDGVFFSNGPGDPSAAPYAVDNAKEILGKVPVFGICMGHQVLGQAFGANTFKMKFGHHGSNHPIKHVPTGRIEISSQNHNFAVDPAGLPEGVEVTHTNLNDGTCAGMVWAEQKAMTIQYHPEASPGPHDADVCFDDFITMMKEARNEGNGA